MLQFACQEKKPKKKRGDRVELIIALILGAIVFGRIWSDKAAGKAFDRESAAREKAQERFLDAVVDKELEKRIESEAMTEESLEKVKTVIESLPACKKMYEMNQDTPAHQQWFYNKDIRKLILMAQYGKLPAWYGARDFQMWKGMAPCYGNYSLEAEMELAKWIQQKLRDHGVEAQVVYDQHILENGKQWMPAEFQWEPFATGGTRI